MREEVGQCCHHLTTCVTASLSENCPCCLCGYCCRINCQALSLSLLLSLKLSGTVTVTVTVTATVTARIIIIIIIIITIVITVTIIISITIMTILMMTISSSCRMGTPLSKSSESRGREGEEGGRRGRESSTLPGFLTKKVAAKDDVTWSGLKTEQPVMGQRVGSQARHSFTVMFVSSVSCHLPAS